jgi:hypothetical protein
MMIIISQKMIIIKNLNLHRLEEEILWGNRRLLSNLILFCYFITIDVTTGIIVYRLTE